ncbi:MAG: hypothetical protein M0Q26_05885 [Chitinophagaceae bacterium]|nr:hypothetical protein [Chitinophagaceae bacterium]MDP1763413.1 hypothetical protein [Sediminibacterium sp.]
MSKDSEAYQALTVFSLKYDPAKTDKATDLFTSKEIQQIILKHTGVEIPLTELHNLLRDMHYEYELEGDEFKWLCVK